MTALVMGNALSDDESRMFDACMNQIERHTPNNLRKQAYYEGEQRVSHLGIALPPRLEEKIRTVVGWAGTAVDVLEERLDLLGWIQTEEDYGLDEVFDANDLDSDSGLGHLDSLIFGTSFVAVGTREGGGTPLVSIESPLYMTGLRDSSMRRLYVAASKHWNEDEREYLAAALHLLDESVYLSRRSAGDRWRVDYRDQHKLNRVPVVPMRNRPRPSREYGRSEISRAVRGYTDAAVRTLLGMEVNRDFFSAPQRWALDVQEDQFTRKDGTVATGWESIMGRMLAVPFDPENPDANPTVGQFPQSTPGPYLDQVRGLAQLLAAECAIPTTYLGFSTDSAASADAIRAMEARLLKRAERRQLTFGRAWLEVGRLALLMRDGKIPDTYDENVYMKWRDAGTPTRSAAADEATKLVAAGILPPTSGVTMDRVGLSPMEQKQITVDRRRMTVSEIGGALANRPAAAPAGRMPAGGPPSVNQLALQKTPAREAD